MTQPLATLIVGLATTYAAIGAGFALIFVARGIDAIDPMARGASWAPPPRPARIRRLLAAAARALGGPVDGAARRGQRAPPTRAEARVIAPLRRAHRWITAAWWLLPPVMAAAMWGRP